MSERIPLDVLKDMARAEMLDQRDFDWLCDCVIVLAEAVEAAHTEHRPCIARPTCPLCAALARFQFEERP